MLADPVGRSLFSTERKQTEFVGPLVLVIEGHEDTRLLLHYFLQSEGYSVVEASDGEEGIRTAIRVHPELIVLDSDLPHVDGWMATQRMRELPDLHDVPIIFISAHAQPEDRSRALASGGNEYFVKPVSLSDLGTALDRHMQNRHRKGFGKSA